jgi:hypothetical protein
MIKYSFFLVLGIGRFRDTVPCWMLPDFPRFPAGAGNCFNELFTDPSWEILL